MDQELARTVVGMPIAALWPQTLPYLARSRARATIVAGLSTLYVLAPRLPDASSLALLGIAMLTAFSIWRAPLAETNVEGPKLITPALIAGVLLAIAAVALTDLDAASDAIQKVVDDDQTALAIIGLTGCVFIGGAFVAWVLSPFTKALADMEQGSDLQEASRLHSLANAGRYIGWFERAILFGFVLGGVPQAAALALAAKSFARFPTLREHQEGFAEYFLIGSLGSITIALGAAAATRAAIGIPLLS